MDDLWLSLPEIEKLTGRSRYLVRRMSAAGLLGNTRVGAPNGNGFKHYHTLQAVQAACGLLLNSEQVNGVRLERTMP